jgi:WD40-like Beta Propeller Repeat
VGVGEADQCLGLLHDCGAVGGAGDGNAPAAAELEQSLVTQFAKGAKDGVGVHAEHARQILGGWEPVAGPSFAVRDGTTDRPRDLVVEGGEARLVDLEIRHGASYSSVIRSKGATVTITAPPRPPSSHTPNVPRRPHFTEPDDREALIEEARKRARRRRKGYGACAVLGAAAVGFLGFHNAYGHAGARQASRGETLRVTALPSAGTSGQLAISDIGGTTVVNGDGTNLRVLGAPRSQVTFSPDGRELTYLVSDGRIVSVTQATGRVRTIVRLGAHRWADPRWSPDGRALAYAFGPTSSGSSGQTSIAVVSQDGVNRSVVARNASPYFHWSPTGEWIAYADPTFTRIWLVRPDGSDRHLAISGLSPRSGGFGQPDFSWSPDGRQIAFIAGSPERLAVVVERVDGTMRRSIVTGPHLYDAQWSPDGQSIAFLRNGTLVVRQLATGAETPVAHGAFAEQWSPDGRWIAYLTIRIDRDGIGRGTVDVVARDGTQRHEIAMLHKPEAPVWGPDAAARRVQI